MIRFFLILCVLFASLGLAGCSGGPLLSDVRLSAPELAPAGNGESVSLSYTVGRPAQVWVRVEDGHGARFTLRDGDARVASTTPYTLRFDGTVPTGDPVLARRLLPSGNYTITVEARAADGQGSRQQVNLALRGSDVQAPLISNLVVSPATISPNADGIDDVAELTYGLPVTATIDVVISGPDGTVYPFVTGEPVEPGLQRHVWNGRTLDGSTLPDGDYRYTLHARDRFGNLVERGGTIGIRGGGTPEATIIDSRIAPQAVMLGEVITVTLRVRNTGKVPIRTYGPPSGHEYSTRDVFSSIEGGRYEAKPGGFWRVGMDWDANSGGGPKRYPFRWAISPRPPGQWKAPFQEDVLMPGEEAVVVGRVRIEQPETKMGFYVGLIQDGVGFRQDRLGRTIVQVGF